MFIEKSENWNHNENVNINTDLSFTDKSIKDAYKVLYNKKGEQDDN